MACDATARLYDVDEHSVVFKKLDKTAKYDQGTVTFRARKGALVDLDKLHESVWATRLSGGTRSGIVSLEVTVIGELHTASQQTVLKVSGSNAEFILQQHSGDGHVATFGQVQMLTGSGKVVRLTGQIDNYVGRWPSVLKKQPTKPRRILVTNVEVEE
ncbi:MAG: hypothetical protein QGH33_09735 [Pirellulaceae bacterium]|nr:hypothetical protein [Pirellulaceae bacterium]MDP7210322.1 hypothetical protein [Vicinamibacterales bacterium]HJN10810.1 hypothetical protein [Pirellulaceae bacterium]